ncbi:thermonuclease family protein [Mucilaginibacter rubeus]|uniref:Thermonuclease family protein n=1 Tax=Mucilaginibacter rubeus TaxID=2027860 RepID=A0AAE6MJ14_9SPHI|nr:MULTISPECIES: thermonuclease family protein [Mucilaginibacter]QEM05196.1 thermonuclease family protein [Mucilaginibacter rubeus]QEM17790.1 thermonuclease family protein [Mucilaginibacter gossypii]QTE45684.1 thermonuclease family protein [Mucilaginibacter rubeus]QTE52281.1 thermonuclease family protein [Mucilaginibacter rubeus]QTE57368.1 thermonuclease family protein [Mucilaginibacter rubeus]
MIFKKYSALLVLVLLIIAGCNPNNTKQSDAGVYKVVKIKDGDTLGLLTGDNQQVTVRLAEIDCPEKSQAFGQAAKKFTSDLCFGKEVKLIGNEHDRYGRTVAQVVLIDGTNINYALVKNGYAWQYKAYSKNTELAALEQQAREDKLGLWQDANPTPPWDFRREKKQPKTDSLQTPKPKKHYRKHKPRLEYAA